ncbi:amidohydrolase family protein [Marinobacter sp. M216]|uniref:Amidohydrolase family protein n=1 Tax=Marinobacter albus TaxID=3030833 RepID=A0ABT7HGY7_9GAMM|nr:MULTISPECIES: amidohydrolase [unclassified Marinobacter]MDK9559162.1 amidohydrolase family protein [Marinobacter sp. M216]
MRYFLSSLLSLGLLVASHSGLAAETADTVFLNGNILTLDDNQPTAEAVAVRNGKILSVGTRGDIMALVGNNTNQIDLEGKTLLPGFVDSHGHAWMIGFQALTANLLPPPDGEGKDIDSLISLLEGWAKSNEQAVKDVGWIIGFGYDNSQLAEQRHPTRHDLDRVSEDIPVLIIHQSGHLGVANSKALEIAGIDAETRDPEGGVFQREEGGNQPNGVAEEYAFFQLAFAFGKSLDPKTMDTFAREGSKLLASFGYTTAQEGRATGASLNAIRRVAEAGALKIDVVVYPDILEVDAIEPSSEYTNRFRVGGAKLTIDGSPQGKTAWLTEPYYVAPPGKDEDYAGYPAITEKQAMDAVEKAYANNWQILTHTNGDAAIDLLIKAVSAAKQKYPDVENRPVMIHGQTLRKDQVGPLKELGIFPSLFPMHTFYWGDYHRDSVLGPERAMNISPTGWLMQQDMMFGSHHDAPVALPDSMRVLSATVTRRSRSGAVIGENHRVPIETALKAMTIWPAWQHFEEDRKGTITAGKLADLVVLSDDPKNVPEDQLDDLLVLETYKEGVSVYKRSETTANRASPALFGLAPIKSHDGDHEFLGENHLHGDGCFNPGLSLLINAVVSGRAD